MTLILPTKGSIVYRHQKGDKRFRAFTKTLNSLIIFLYRINFLPCFGIGREIIIIETIGRKTGLKRRRPVLYKMMYTGKMTLYSARGKNADWLRNILSTENHILKIQKGFRRLNVRASLIESEEEKLQHLAYWCENFRDAKNLFGYNRKIHGDIFQTQEFLKLAQMLEFIQLAPV